MPVRPPLVSGGERGVGGATFVQDAKPQSPESGDTWLDTASEILWRYTGSIWVVVTGTFQRRIASFAESDLTVTGDGVVQNRAFVGQTTRQSEDFGSLGSTFGINGRVHRGFTLDLKASISEISFVIDDFGGTKGRIRIIRNGTDPFNADLIVQPSNYTFGEEKTVAFTASASDSVTIYFDSETDQDIASPNPSARSNSAFDLSLISYFDGSTFDSTGPMTRVGVSVPPADLSATAEIPVSFGTLQAVKYALAGSDSATVSVDILDGTSNTVVSGIQSGERIISSTAGAQIDTAKVDISITGSSEVPAVNQLVYYLSH